jgi:hypothetical protein
MGQFTIAAVGFLMDDESIIFRTNVVPGGIHCIHVREDNTIQIYVWDESESIASRSVYIRALDVGTAVEDEYEDEDAPLRGGIVEDPRPADDTARLSLQHLGALDSQRGPLDANPRPLEYYNVKSGKLVFGLTTLQALCERRLGHTADQIRDMSADSLAQLIDEITKRR